MSECMEQALTDELQRAGLMYEPVFNDNGTLVCLRDLAENDWPEPEFPIVTDMLDPAELLIALQSLPDWDYEGNVGTQYIDELYDVMRALVDQRKDSARRGEVEYLYN